MIVARDVKADGSDGVGSVSVVSDDVGDGNDIDARYVVIF
jgi:hypothetical protein